MKFNTALCFLLAGISVTLIRRAKQAAKVSLGARICSTLVLLIGALTITKYASGFQLGIDQVINDPWTAKGDFPGRMSVATAVGATLLGTTLLLVNTSTRKSPVLSQILALLVFTGALIAFLGYVLDPQSLYQLPWFSSVALHTSVLFIGLSLCALLLSRNLGLMRPLTSKMLGGRFARIMLPTTTLYPILIGILLARGVESNLLNFHMAVVLFIVGATMTISLIIWVNAREQNRIHADMLEQLERVRRSEQENSRLAAIITHSKDGVVCVDEFDQIRVWNLGAQEIFGHTAEEALGKPLSEVIPHTVFNQGWLQEARENKHVNGRAITLAKCNGQLIDVSVSISPVRDADGVLTAVSIIARDVTEMRLLEHERDIALRDLVNFKAALDEHAIVAMTDARGRINYVNDKFCHISGYSAEELIGQDHRLINSGYHPKEFFQVLWKTISQGNIWRGTICNRTKHGELYYVETTIVPFLDEDGKPQQFIAIRTDVTSMERANEALAEQTAELRRSNNDLEQFAYIASHDLQEPLRGIDGCVRLLASRYREQLDDSGREFIDHAVGNVERMQRLIKDLLAYSRVGMRGCNIVALKLQDALDDALMNLNTLIAEQNAVITSDPLPVIYGDRGQITQVLQNLISNALKFSRDTPKIHIGAQGSGDLWEIAISDNGIGIDREYHQKIFVIFQRLHNREAYPGTGIGLALCKRIVEHHGGRIRVMSQEGAGSTFYFSLRPVEGQPRPQGKTVAV
ncbi:sensor histidine kinase [Cerasicoccus fimbriatus]|uniref:sensor histidine kinase n=1 Tax=Cerasicoccus fimbriatus TaxID=3014554 RepID=UPI0022B4561C|nr:PAS domain S-box protein [Cerasicoccus sp. TK19100]